MSLFSRVNKDKEYLQVRNSRPIQNANEPDKADTKPADSAEPAKPAAK